MTHLVHVTDELLLEPFILNGRHSDRQREQRRLKLAPIAHAAVERPDVRMQLERLEHSLSVSGLAQPVPKPHYQRAPLHRLLRHH